MNKKQITTDNSLRNLKRIRNCLLINLDLTSRKIKTKLIQGQLISNLTPVSLISRHCRGLIGRTFMSLTMNVNKKRWASTNN